MQTGFPSRASAWSWLGLVLTNPCSFAVWHAVPHLVESLWLMWRDSHCKTVSGSVTACGGCEVPVKVLPECVMYLLGPFSFQSDITPICSSRTMLACQSYVTAAPVWQLLRVFISRRGVTGSEDKCWLSWGEWAVRLCPSVCHWHTCTSTGMLPEHQQRLWGPWARAPGRPRTAASADCRGYCRSPQRESKYFHREIKALLAWLL